MKKHIEYNELTEEMFSQLEKGAFLTTKQGKKVNTMTIAWGGINVLWGKRVFVAYVRFSRETYNLIMNPDEFSISVPINKDMRKELLYCGTKSFRDVNKIDECNLTLIDGNKIQTPIIGECDLHYECNIIYRQTMEAAMVPKDVLKKYYSNNDFHVIFYGEIVDSYILESE